MITSLLLQVLSIWFFLPLCQKFCIFSPQFGLTAQSYCIAESAKTRCSNIPELLWMWKYMSLLPISESHPDKIQRPMSFQKKTFKNPQWWHKVGHLGTLCPSVIFQLAPRTLQNSLTVQRENKHSFCYSPLEPQALPPVLSTHHFQKQLQELAEKWK